jgi:hypothetical protein
MSSPMPSDKLLCRVFCSSLLIWLAAPVTMVRAASSGPQAMSPPTLEPRWSRHEGEAAFRSLPGVTSIYV